MRKVLSLLRQYVLFIALAGILAIIAGGVFLLRKLDAEVKKLEGTIKTQYGEVKKYKQDPANAPSPELIRRLSEEKLLHDKTFRTLLTKFSTRFPSPPQYRLYPAIEFKEFLFATQEELALQAQRKKVSLPSSFGFPETGLVAAEQIPLLSLQIAVLKDLVELLIDSGVSFVNTITPGIPKNVAFYRVLPLEISITGTSTEIVRFLKFLENPSSFFVLENFTLTRSDTGLFRANMVLNAVLLEIPKDEPAAAQPAPSGAPNAPPGQQPPGAPPQPRSI